MNYRQDIDGLRGLAVLSVVLFHFFPQLVRGGFLGVDIFFVISGYLITSILCNDLENKTFNLFHFYQRRIYRLFPSLLAVLLVTGIAGWFTLSLPGLKQLGKHLIGSLTFSSNFIFWSESNYFDLSSHTKPLWHSWSLAIEEQFYLLWPLVLFGLDKLKLKKIYIISILIISSLALCFYFESNDQDQIFFSPLTRMWEIFVGAFISQVRLNLTRKQAAFLSCLGLSYIVISLFILTENLLYPIVTMLPVLGTAFLILAGETALINRRFFSLKPFVWAGLISYPLYLWHWPLLSFSQMMNVSQLSIILKLVLFLVSVVLAWLSYAYLERPIRSLGISQSKYYLLAVFVATAMLGLFLMNVRSQYLSMPTQLNDLMNRNDLKELYLAEWRHGTCYLNADQKFEWFSKCPDSGNIQSKETLLLWGDSHAAHLYPGLLKRFGSRYKIVQRTASACPPLLNAQKEHRQYCKSINDKILGSIEMIKPSKIILAGRWHVHPREFLAETINGLKAKDIKNIVVVGAFPFWNNGLPNQLFLENKTAKTRFLPSRLKNGLDPDILPLDKEMETYVTGLNAKYISAVKILCNSEGCLTRVGDSWDSVVSYDSTHLTPRASEVFVSQMEE